MGKHVFKGHIVQPPNTPGAHRVWELIGLINTQVAPSWLGYADAIGAGYSSAWYKQFNVLKDIQESILAEMQRSALILSIIASGFGGAIMGGAMAGIFGKAAVEELSGMIINNALSNAGSTLGAGLVAQSQPASGAFTPVGPEPSTYTATMRANVSELFMFLQRVIGGVVKELEKGNAPRSEGDSYYESFSNLPFIANFPDDRDMNDDFERDSGLALWIAWGAQRDFDYWTDRWTWAKTGSQILQMASRAEIARWDPILDEINRLEPTLPVFIRTAFDRQWHLDIRKLKDMGKYVNTESLQALSRFWFMPKRVMTFGEAQSLAGSVGAKSAFAIYDATQSL